MKRKVDDVYHRMSQKDDFFIFIKRALLKKELEILV